jgi:hypothetical protein
MIFVVRLFLATPMADNRIAQTNRALTQDRSSTSFDPIGFEVELCSRKWDKENRGKSGSALGGDLAESLPGAEPFPPCENLDWKEYPISTPDR